MTQFPRVRDVLNKLKTLGQLDHDVVLLVRDRAIMNVLGVPGAREIHGDAIRLIRKREFETDEATIPFYKVTVIWWKGERLWERPQAFKLTKWETVP